jgi:uncharacterized membrane protein
MDIKERRKQDGGEGLQRALIGATAVAAAAGAALFVGSKMRSGRGEPWISDAPRSTRRGKNPLIGRTVTIGKPRQEIYDFWRDFSNLSKVMENVERIDVIDSRQSHWVVKAPGGGTVEWDAIVTEDEPERLIAWESVKGADIRSAGKVEFLDAPPGRGTMVRLTMVYDPPGGVVGQWVAKLLQREPAEQARRDLRRLKQFLETGEVSSSAGPSGRKSESPTRQYI